MKSLLFKFRDFYEILYDTIKGFIGDDAFTYAAAVSYYGLTSIIPVFVLIVSILSYFVDSTDQSYNWILEQVNAFSPDIAYKYDIYLKNLISEVIQIRGTALGFGIVSLLWIGMNTVCALENTLNVVMKVTVERNYFHRRLISLLFILLLFLLLYGTTIIPTIINTEFIKDNLLLKTLNIDISYLWNLGTKISTLVVYFLAFFLIYRVLPRVKMPTVALVISSVNAAITWAVAKLLFSWFVINVSQYSKIYGSMAALMIFVIWLYFSVIIMIFYGEMLYAIKQRLKLNVGD